MATRYIHSGAGVPLWDGEEMSRRIALAREPDPQATAGPRLRHLLGELRYLLEPFVRPFRRIDIPRAAVPRTVMIMPGFATNPWRMRYLARQLEKAGHKVKRWGLGYNLGPNAESLAFLEERLAEVHARYGREVVLVGWSLGGLFARELAKRRPELVAKVITMGTPFSGNPRANNAWRLYQFVAGHSVDAPPVSGAIAAKPPVPTVALWSASDGIVSARSACGQGERDRAVALRCNHLGFSYAPECIRTLLRELEDC